MSLKLKFSLRAWAKLNYLMLKGDTEVGGYGLLSDNRGELEVTDFILIPQEATAASVTFDDEGYEDYVEEMALKGMNPDRFLRIWIHTHPGNSAKPSTTDETSWSNTFGTMNWAVMFILARGGDTYCRIKVSTEFGYFPYEIEHEIKWDMEYPTEADKAAWDADYERCVKKPTYTYTPYQGHWGGRGDDDRPVYYRDHKKHDKFDHLYTLRSDGQWYPKWIPAGQERDWERSNGSTSGWRYVGGKKNTTPVVVDGEPVDDLFKLDDDDKDIPEDNIECDAWYLDNVTGEWEQSIDACLWVASTTLYRQLDEVDFRLIHWYCENHGCPPEENDDYCLWKFFESEMERIEEERDEAQEKADEEIKRQMELQDDEYFNQRGGA